MPKRILLIGVMNTDIPALQHGRIKSAISRPPTAEDTDACRGLNTTMNGSFALHRKIAKLIVLTSATFPEVF